MKRRWPAALAATLIPCTIAAKAQESDARTPARPALAGRVVRVFDFEEQTTNPGDVPRDWYRVQDNPSGVRRAGFPEWNKASLTYVAEGGMAARGQGAVVLPTQGGCTSLLLGEGVVPMFEDAQYMVRAKVRTAGLKHARACIGAVILDRANKPIPGARVRSELVRSENEWTDLAVELPQGVHDAAFLQIELLLLQPEQYTEAVAGPFHVWEQDFAGSAWFDDLSILQPPRTRLTTPFAGNVILSSETPELRASVRDMTGEHLTARMRVLDARGRIVAEEERPMGGAATEAVWHPVLPRFGWYRARLDVLSDGDRVGGAFVDLVRLAPDREAAARSPDQPSKEQSIRAQSEDRGRFGVMINELPPGAGGVVPEVVRRLGVGGVTGPISAGESGRDAVPLIDSLLADWREPTLCLPAIPPAVAEKTGLPESDPWSMFLRDREVWMPAMGNLLDRYGQRIRRWQVGRWQDTEAVIWRPKLWGEASAIRASLSALVAGPVVTMPAPIDVARVMPRSADGLSILAVADQTTTARAVEEYISGWTDGGDTRVAPMTLLLPNISQDRYGLEAGPIELAKRAVAFWAGASRSGGGMVAGAVLEAEQPWRWTSGREAMIQPRPEFSALHTLLGALDDRRVVGRFPVADGVVCWILAPSPGAPKGRGGALVAWNESARESDAVVEAYLGPGPIRLFDIDGNESAAVWTQAADGGRSVRVPVGHSPVFIEGIDIEFARFLAGFRVEPSLLESNNKSHPREVVIENPWKQTITGKIAILEPGGFEEGRHDRTWRVSPRVMKFAVPPGGTERVPFSVSFSPSEEVGPKDFVFGVELAADEAYQPVLVKRRLEVGLADLTLDLSYSVRGDHGQDLVVEATISNSSHRTLTLDVTAFAPNLPRTKATVVDLVGGNQAVRRMTFPDGVTAARGKKVIVAVRDSASEARVTKSIEIR